MNRPWLTAVDETELVASLSAFRDSPPPPRGERSTQQSEAWSFACALLARPALLQGWYPVVIEAGDKPDFIVTSEGREFGVEVVEAIPQSLAHAISVTNTYKQSELNPDRDEVGLLDLGHYRGSRPEKRSKIIKRYQCGQFDSAPWTGDEVYREWCDNIHKAIHGKVDKLDHGSYRRCTRTHLLVDGHDAAHFSDAELPKALSLLDEMFERNSLAWGGFDEIYILKGSTLSSFCAGRRK